MSLLLWAVGYLGAINALAYSTFAWDKRCAQRGQWRLAEATLLNLALIGGSAGAKLAQRKLRHKSYKQPFGRRLNGIIGFQVLLIVVLPVLYLFPDLRERLFRLIEALFAN